MKYLILLFTFIFCTSCGGRSGTDAWKDAKSHMLPSDELVCTQAGGSIIVKMVIRDTEYMLMANVEK